MVLLDSQLGNNAPSFKSCILKQPKEEKVCVVGGHEVHVALGWDNSCYKSFGMQVCNWPQLRAAIRNKA